MALLRTIRCEPRLGTIVMEGSCVPDQTPVALTTHPLAVKDSPVSSSRSSA